MTKRQKTSYPSVQIGTSLLLVVLIVLCLVTFAVLSLSSALKDYNFSQKNAQKTTEFYEADAAANEKLAQIDASLQNIYSIYPDTWSGHVQEALSGLDEITFSTEDNTAAYEVRINDEQALDVTLRIASAGHTDEGLYQVIQWQKITSAEWNGDSSLSLMKTK